MAWTRKKKKYSRPRKAYDINRIKDENLLIEKYGLKNKKEIWKADAAVSRIRNQAKNLITAKKDELEKFFGKLNAMGFKVGKIADALELNKENWLKRRLQSILAEKKHIKIKGARQLITHKHVAINGNVINIPGYMVKVNEENKIEIRRKK